MHRYSSDVRRIETIRVVQNFLFGVSSFKWGFDNGAGVETSVIKVKLNEERYDEDSECFTRRVLRVNNSGSHVAILGNLFHFLISIATTCGCAILRVSAQPYSPTFRPRPCFPVHCTTA